jgi:NACalpha-BTF3-like transcription factor
MTRQEVFIITFIVILLLGNIFFAGQYLYGLKEIKAIKKVAIIQKNNEKIINFAKLFIKDVLRSENEVNFETRLKLENAVRNTNNKEILSIWQKFIESKSETEAQNNVKDLLEAIINNIGAK